MGLRQHRQGQRQVVDGKVPETRSGSSDGSHSMLSPA